MDNQLTADTILYDEFGMKIDREYKLLKTLMMATSKENIYACAAEIAVKQSILRALHQLQNEEQGILITVPDLIQALYGMYIDSGQEGRVENKNCRVAQIIRKKIEEEAQQRM